MLLPDQEALMAYKKPEPISEKIVEDVNKDLDVTDRAGRIEACIALKMAGATYTQIAEVLEYASAAEARKAFERGVAASVGDDDRAVQRALATRRLERILRSLWPKATDDEDPEHIGYARTALAYIDRIIRLQGADAPSEMVLYTPSNHEIDEWLKKMHNQAHSDLPEEYDIITGEVIAGETSMEEIESGE